MFKTGVTQKFIADLSITQHVIANYKLIYSYYNNYSKYQTGLREVLPSYGKDSLLMPLNDGFLKLNNIWYTSDLGFNLISTILLGGKRVEMWLQITD